MLLAILGNFEGANPETVIEEIFVKLRNLDKDESVFRRHLRQLDILSTLRDLQPLLIKQREKMNLTELLKEDWLYKQGMERGMEKGVEQGEETKVAGMAVALLQKGLAEAFISGVTGLPIVKVIALRQNLDSRK